MITCAAVVPHPPLLVPELAAGAVEETAELRAEVEALAGRIAARGELIAVGAGRPAGWMDQHARGSFAGFGADTEVSLSEDATVGATVPADPWMPLAALVAGWLRGRIGTERIRVLLVPDDLPPADCLAIGDSLAGELPRDQDTGLLVLGDGSNRHGARAPGTNDDRAPEFDDRVHDALATADRRALAGIDPGRATELGATGRAPWQVLAGVPGDWTATRARLLVPYGVAYHLAEWSRG